MNELIIAFIASVVLMGGFLLFRHVFLWYWKINEIVELLKAIKDK